MAFADWVKRSDLAATALSRHQNMREVLQAAYKAGERQGRSDAEALEQNAVARALNNACRTRAVAIRARYKPTTTNG